MDATWWGKKVWSVSGKDRPGGGGSLHFNNVEARTVFQCCKARQVWKARKEKSEAAAAAEAADAGVCDFTTAHHAASFVCQCIRH